MKKHIALFVCLLLLSLCVLSTTQGQGEQRVFDQAHLMGQTEIDSLESRIASMKSKYDMDFVVLTADDVKTGGSQAYADDFYDQHNFGAGSDASGFLFLIDMANREIHVSTSGLMIRYMTDARVDVLLDAVVPYVTGGEYGDAADMALSQVEVFLKNGIPENQYNQDEQGNIDPYQPPKPKAVTLGEAAIALFSGLAAALILFFTVRGAYAMKGSAYSYDLKKNAAVNITGATDVFLRTQVTRVPRASSNSGGSAGGRSSTHHSSSGRVHGGGGRKF